MLAYTDNILMINSKRVEEVIRTNEKLMSFEFDQDKTKYTVVSRETRNTGYANRE